MPRLQCKWTHSDSGSQNLDRTPGILVYGSFKTGQGLSGYLEPPPSKGCLPAEQPLDQLVAPVVFIYDESLIDHNIPLDVNGYEDSNELMYTKIPESTLHAIMS